MVISDVCVCLMIVRNGEGLCRLTLKKFLCHTDIAISIRHWGKRRADKKVGEMIWLSKYEPHQPTF